MERNTVLVHHGVEGQKWGVQNGPPYPLDRETKKIVKQAQKDAKEYARAKMFYGEGAGNRRKLINATVEERSKNPIYKQEFEASLEKQDMAEHANKAKAERSRKDAASKAKHAGKTAVGVMSGGAVKVTATASAILAAYGVAKATGLDQKIINAGKDFVSKQQSKKFMNNTGQFWK